MSTTEQTNAAPVIDREIKVMSPHQGGAPSQVSVPESFYKLTPAEIKQLYQSQVNKRQSLDNAPLKTKQMRNLEEKERMKKYPKTTIRVMFSDGLILQINFLSNEKVSTLYSVVRSTLRNPDQEFLLCLPPRRQLVDMNETIFKAGLAPASKVTFVGAATAGSKGLSELSEQYLKNVQQMPRPPDMTDTGNSQAATSSTSVTSIKDNVSKAVPKWLSKGLLKK
ncbi:hypothetical protein BGW37DRAFT_478675 [Umbelopsis sp. PMI_123]|nr:hypothetical protein BGW37DRAFT_478675 [Umbelopsis sp. PMI_123]